MLLISGTTATAVLGGVASGALHAPVNLKPPVISGKAVVGKTLTASRGSWSGSPTSYAYNWLRCVPSLASCAPTGHERTRLVKNADVGFVLRVTVTAFNAAGHTSVLSAPTAAVRPGPPVNTSLPVISGLAEQGLTLTASHGIWSGTPTSYTYHWLRCDPLGAECESIAGTSASHLLGLVDVGSTLRAKVTAANSVGKASATSAASELVLTLATGGAPHVMVIVEENRSRGEVIGNPGFPYVNSLADRYGDTTSWSGVSHPSLPNYLALVSGSTHGVTDDGCGYSFAGATIGSQLSVAGIGWRAYIEGLPSPGSTTCEASGAYAKKHNPFAYFPRSNGPNVVPAGSGASQLKSDLVDNAAPPFLWLTPNLCNDGHACSNETTDSYLDGLIPTVLASKWYAEEGTVIITWDEDEGEGRIATVVLHGAGSGKVLTTAGNHYGTLATIEDLYGVPRLGKASSAATLAPLLK